MDDETTDLVTLWRTLHGQAAPVRQRSSFICQGDDGMSRMSVLYNIGPAIQLFGMDDSD
jgi:hypothetical protein